MRKTQAQYISRHNNEEYFSVYVCKINISNINMSNILWSLKLRVIRVIVLDKKSILFPTLSSPPPAPFFFFFFVEWNHQGKLKTCQSEHTLKELAPLSLKRHSKRFLGCSIGYSSNSNKKTYLELNKMFLKQDESGPTLTLRVLQNSGWE